MLINYLLNTFLHTLAGVLDPEELCAMNKGFKRRESFLFPGIQENLKMRRSADSESTFDSDEFSLESVEGDLFEDIRASIHRSCGTFTTTSCKSICGKAGMQISSVIILQIHYLVFKMRTWYSAC